MAEDERAEGPEHEATPEVAPEVPPKPSPEDLERELERARKQLQAANADARRNRTRLDELERAEREREEAKLGEAEKVKRQQAAAEQKAREAEQKAAALAAEMQQLRVDYDVEREAGKPGPNRFRYPQDVPKLIDRSLIVVDDDGRVSLPSVQKAVERLAKERPGLLEADNRGGTPPRSNIRQPEYRGTGQPGDRIDDRVRERLATGEYGRM